MNLYNIQQEYLSLIQEIEENGGEITEDQENALAINQSDLEAKTENYIGLIAQLDSEVQMAKEMEKRAKEYARRKQAIIDRLKSNLLNAVKLYGNQTVGVTEIKTRKSESVQILNQEDIPDDFIVRKVTAQPDKTEIKRAIKAGLPVAGAVLVKNESLVIK